MLTMSQWCRMRSIRAAAITSSPRTSPIYGVDLVLANVTGFVILGYMRSHPELCFRQVDRAVFRRQVPTYAVTNGIYVLAIGLAWSFPWLSYGLYAGVLLWMMVRYTRIPNPLQPGEPGSGQGEIGFARNRIG